MDRQQDFQLRAVTLPPQERPFRAQEGFALMMRQIIPLALIALALLPDWATAFGKRQYPPCPPAPTAYLPCPPQLVILPQCLPSFEVLPYNTPSFALPAPTVTPETAKPEAAKPDTPLPSPPKAPMPGLPPNRSSLDAGSSETGLKQAELVVPNLANPTAAKPQPTPAVTEPLIVPPVRNVFEAKREPETPRIPALIPRIPGGDASLPPLLVPTPANDTPGTSTSRSSPLNASRRPGYDVIPVDGPAPATPSAKRSVGFFNHTDRDLQLTVEGQTITLPKRHSVTADVPAKFTWTLEGNLEQITEIPLAAPGVEVVIRR